MTERQKKLVKDYGPKFYAESKEIMDEFISMSCDASSVLTDEEWKDCKEAMLKFVTELQKVRKLVRDRIKEVEAPVN